MTTSHESDGEVVPAAGERRRSRERVLGLLYEAEAKNEDAEQVLAGLPSRPERYAAVLFSGTFRRLGEIDALIGTHASGWALERMPAVDRQLLRIATFELLERRDVPCAVVLDEAVELAKLYSTEDSSRFVNGVLAALAAELRSEEIALAAGAAPEKTPGL